MADADNRAWLDALAGRPAAADAELSTLREAAAVRQAMLASPRPPPKLDADAGARRLLNRLRAEKLLDGAGRAPIGWKVPAAAGVAALVIASGLALRERPSTPRAAPEVPVATGDPTAAYTVVTRDTQAIADELREMMTQAGLSPTVTQRGSLTRLEADWPRRPSDEQLEFLKNYGFARPDGPQLRIEIRPLQQ